MATDPDSFRAAISDFPTGVTVVTAVGENGPSGATANAVASLSLDPPMMLACLDQGSRTLASVRGAGSFAINVLAAEQAELARRFSTKDAEADKWDGIDSEERDGTPKLAGVILWIRCELRDLLDGGDHAIVTGTVQEVESSGGEPLVFHRGTYRGLG